MTSCWPRRVPTRSLSTVDPLFRASFSIQLARFLCSNLVTVFDRSLHMPRRTYFLDRQGLIIESDERNRSSERLIFTQIIEI